MDNGIRELERHEHDPALLAFIKCHITSFTRWDALRVLAERTGQWIGANEVARLIHKPAESTKSALDDLERERLVRRRRSASGPTYRLDPADPTSRVVERLVEAARHDQELRQVIVARVLNDERAAAGTRGAAS